MESIIESLLFTGVDRIRENPIRFQQIYPAGGPPPEIISNDIIQSVFPYGAERDTITSLYVNGAFAVILKTKAKRK
jgi:hypothetical protein